MKFRIKDSIGGTYFRAMTGIGPAFGATKKDAATFDGGWLAYETIKRFPMVVLADLVNEDGKPCDIQGKSLAPEKAKGRKK